MEIEEGRALLRRCQEDRRVALEAVRAGQATVESSQLIIEGILRRFPELSDDEHEFGELSWEVEGQPRGDKAVLSILQVNENQWFSVQEMVEMLEGRGWLTESANPPNAVRSALERLKNDQSTGVKKSKYQKSGTVIYRYQEPPPPSELGYGTDEEPF